MRAGHATCEQRPVARSLHEHTKRQAWALNMLTAGTPTCAVQQGMHAAHMTTNNKRAS